MKPILLSIGILLQIWASAQAVLNDKQYYDSLKQNDWSGNTAFTFVLNKSSTNKLFLTNTTIASLPLKQHLFELSESFYFDGTTRFSNDNRLNIYARAALFRHLFSSRNHKKEKLLFPEIIFAYLYDESRGLTHRFQLGTNLMLNIHDWKPMRLKTGLGILKEWETWRIIDRQYLPILDTASPAFIQLIKDRFGINKRGEIQRSNERINVFLQLLSNVLGKINLNVVASIQFPLELPYKNLPQLAVFPVVTKYYPRFTIDAVMSLPVSKKISIVSRYYGQFDEGQLSPYVNKSVYTFSQGVQVHF
jgi:hypothetical protein